MSEKTPPLSSSDPGDERIKLIVNWARQRHASWGSFLRKLWSDPAAINEQEALSERLATLFPEVDRAFFTNQELVISLLEQQPFAWHDAHLQVYEESLEYLLPHPLVAPYLAYLARVRVGVSAAFLHRLCKQEADPGLCLELKILHLIRLKELADQVQLQQYAEAAVGVVKAFKEHNTSATWEAAMYELPVLGLLWHQDKPHDFLLQCLEVNSFIQSLTGHRKLTRHLRQYCRYATMSLCKLEAWENVLRIKFNSRDWLAQYLEVALATPAMEAYAEKLLNLEKEKLEDDVQNRKGKDVDDLADYQAKGDSRR